LGGVHETVYLWRRYKDKFDAAQTTI